MYGKRIDEGHVLDMIFARDIDSVSEKGEDNNVLNDRYLYQDNEALEGLGKIFTMLADCMDEVKEAKGFSPGFQFYISSSERL